MLRDYAGRLAAAPLNVTSLRSPAAVERRHIVESLALAAVLERAGALPAGASVIDVGSGGGLPGIPLAVARPDLRVTLLEATGKKAAFLRDTTSVLGLANVAVLAARAEEAGRDPTHRERYHLAVARAVAALDALAELTLPFVQVGGWLTAVKGSRVQEEIAAAAAAVGQCGGRLERVAPLASPGNEPLVVVLIAKVASTPPDLPRRPGVPAKRPLR